MSRHYNFTSARAALRVQRILALLEKEALTIDQIAARLHMANSGIHKYIVHLHSEPKRVFVADWDRSGYRAIAMFAAGNAPDAMKPPKKSKADFWQETKSDPKKLAKTHAHQAALRARKRNGAPPKKPMRTYDPPIEQQVLEFVKAWPGMRAPQIAEKLGAGVRSTARALTRLKQQGLVDYKRRSRAGAYWEPAGRKVVRHEPLVTKRQGIFAALGV